MRVRPRVAGADAETARRRVRLSGSHSLSPDSGFRTFFGSTEYKQWQFTANILPGVSILPGNTTSPGPTATGSGDPTPRDSLPSREGDRSRPRVDFPASRDSPGGGETSGVIVVAETPIVRVSRLPHAEGLPLPAAASAGSAGLDLRARGLPRSSLSSPGERLLVPTGLILELPPGWEGQVRPRSGLAVDHGIGLLNSPGTIDSDYRGEVRVLLVNLGSEPFVVRRGDRIAQLVVAPVAVVEVREAGSPEPDRAG